MPILNTLTNIAMNNQPTDYSEFRTPFFEISLSSPSSSTLYRLPFQLEKLVQKIEYVETLGSVESGAQELLVISFIEGSREPLNTEGIEETPIVLHEDGSSFFAGSIKNGITSSISNAPGVLTEIPFEGNSLKSLFTGPIRSITEVIDKLDSILNSRVDKLVKKHRGSALSDTKFLLKGGNQIVVKFGYREKPDSIRTVRGMISGINYDFPENDQPVITLMCTNAATYLDNVTPKSGVLFEKTNDITAILNTASGTTEFKDIHIRDLLQRLADDLGMKLLVSSSFNAPEIGGGKVKMWMGGESLYQFLCRLARDYIAYFFVTINPDTGDHWLVFVKRVDLDSAPVAKNSNLFTYKAPGSIIKSVSIGAEYNLPVKSNRTGISQSGKKIENTTSSTHQLVVEEGATTGFIPPEETKNIKNIENTVGSDNSTSKSSISVSSDKENDYQEQQAEVDATKVAMNLVSLNLVTLGYPKFFTGTYEIKGIGNRFSGLYNINSVTHTIDSSGYICRATGISASINGEGVITDSTPAQKSEIPTSISNLFTSATSFIKNIVEQSPRDKLIDLKTGR